MNNLTKDQIRYIKVSFDQKNDAKELGARWDPSGKCWFIPVGVDPILLKEWWAFIDCPFEEKDEARKLGARWDKGLKSWYVPVGVDFDDFEQWWPGWVKERMELPEREPEEEQWHTVTGQKGQKYTFSFSEDYTKRGGTAQVFFGWRADRETEEIEEAEEAEDPTVAIKNFFIDEDKTDFSMFERELEALREISDHPNIVTLLDYGFDPTDRTFFIVTEYMPFTLSETFTLLKEKTVSRLGEKIELDEEEIEEIEEARKDWRLRPEENWLEDDAPVLEQILNGLCYALNLGIHHRDLKPGNILVETVDEKDLVLKICDFGFSNRVNAITQLDTLRYMGTQLYTPVTHQNDKKFPGARDVYSWGVIAIELFAQKVFSVDDDIREVFEDEVKPYLPVPAGKLIESCISADPAERPENAIEVLKRLTEIRKKLER